jgi:hypothetical protein
VTKVTDSRISSGYSWYKGMQGSGRIMADNPRRVLCVICRLHGQSTIVGAVEWHQLRGLIAFEKGLSGPQEAVGGGC